MKDILLRDALVMVPTAQGKPSGWLESGMLHIKDGRIAGLYPGSKRVPSSIVDPVEVISLKGRAVIPGLVNGHTHLSQTFMRGLSAGRPLLRWLKELIWPLQQALSPELMELAAMLGLLENAKSGAAYVVDHHKVTGEPGYTDSVIRAAEQSGLRVTIARAWADVGANAEPPDAIIEELQAYFETMALHPRITIASGPLTPWRCSADTLVKTHQLAVSHGQFSHIHLSETEDEVAMTLKETGLRPAAWLDSLGILDDHCQVVHAVWVDAEEINLLAERQSPVIHCPVSNAVLGSGIAPIREMLAQGVDLRLGSDGPASNDTQDCFENMKMALCLARAVNRDAEVLPPRQVLEMATCSPGLVEGDRADLAIINLESVWAAPVHDPDSALVMCSRVSDVSDLIVGGEFVMRDGIATMLDEDAILKEADKAIKLLRKKAGLDQ